MGRLLKLLHHYVPWYADSAQKADNQLPSLSLEFDKNRYALNGLPTSLLGTDANSPVTRATTATYVDAAGVVRTAAVNEKRYAGAFWRRNLLTYSEDLSNAAWTKTDVTITANAIAAPNGALTADMATEGSTGSTFLTSPTGNITAGAALVVSAYLKRGSHDWMRFVVQDAAASANAARQWVNLGTGTLGTTQVAGTGAFLSGSTLDPVGDGWYRLSMYCSFGVATTGVVFFTTSTTGDATGTRVNGGTRYMWGCQIEMATRVSPYIPTTSTAMTKVSGGVPLTEAAGTNLALYSEDFSNGWWIKNDMTLTTNAVIAPDGTLTAELVTLGTGGGEYIATTPLAITAGDPVTLSMHLKRGNHDWFRFVIRDNTNAAIAYFWFNLATERFGTISASGGAAIVGTPTIQALGDGWYRVSGTATIAAFTSAQLLLISATGDNVFTRVSGGTRYQWGAQVEVGTSATSYIPTTSAAVTRAADILTPLATFSRASLATMYGPDGLLKNAAHNLITYSEDLSNAAWGKTDVTITADAITAPDGALTADLVTEGSAGTATVSWGNWNFSANQAITLSGYFKRGNHDWMRLIIQDGTTSAIAARQWFNLATGALGSTSTSGGASFVKASTIEDAGNGWYRVAMTVTLASTSTSANQFSASTAGDGSFTRVSGSTRYMWGFQAEVNRTVSQYLPTTSAANYSSLRLGYNPYTREGVGAVIETAGTNLLTYSEDFSNAAWVKNDTTITTDAVASPTGNITADLVTEGSTGGAAIYLFSLIPITSGAYSAFSFYVKAGNHRWIRVSLSDTGSTSVMNFWFDIIDGVVGGTNGLGAAVSGGRSIENVGNGWYRVKCCAAINGGFTSLQVLYRSSDADGSFSRSLNGTRYQWGAQLEAGELTTSYIATTTASATRAEDRLAIPQLSGIYSGGSVSMYAKADVVGPTLSTTSIVNPMLSLDDGTSSNRMMLRRGWNGSSAFATQNVTITGGAGQATISVGSFAAFTPTKAAAVFSTDYFSAAQGGALGTPDTSGTLPAVTTLNLGYNNGSLLRGNLHAMRLYDFRVRDSELQRITT